MTQRHRGIFAAMAAALLWFGIWGTVSIVSRNLGVFVCAIVVPIAATVLFVVMFATLNWIEKGEQ